MSNGYFQPVPRLLPGTTARSSDVMALFDGVEQAFDRLPAEAQIKRDTVNFATTTGSGNAYAATLPFALDAYSDGMGVVLRLNHGNSGPATLNLNGLGAVPVLRINGTPTEGGDMPAGSVVELRYDGSAFRLALAPIGALTSMTDGSFAAPGLRFSADTDTGFVRLGDNSMAAVTGGQPRLAIDALGRVGIGTTAPADPLHVVGNIRLAGGGLVAGDTGTFVAHGATTPNYGLQWTFLSDFPSAPALQLSGFGGIRLYTNSTERVRVANSGTVGIGTGSPDSYDTSARLVVQTGLAGEGIVAVFANSGGNGAGIRFFQNGVDIADIGMPPGAGGLAFRTGGSERMRLGADGNLLIGTSQSGGSISNQAVLTAGRFSTVRGTIVGAPHNTPTAFLTLPDAAATYLVAATILNTGQPGFNATAVVAAHGLGSAEIVHLVAAPANLLTLSGLTLRLTQGVGGPVDIQWSVLRLV